MSINALIIRDRAWKKTNKIPGWVRGRDVDLDQYNTLPEVAQYCWSSLKEVLEKDKAVLKNYRFIEPSAGTGSFYNLLPKNSRIGIDVELFNKNYIQQDFLTWEPNYTDERPCIVIGNPPFGYRGWLALAFINRAAEFCDYVGFILPMSFQSDGKGSPKNRVKGMTIIHSEKLSGDIFVRPSGERIKVNTLWQIWKKGDAPPLPDLSYADNFIELFTVDKRKERLCGMSKIDQCNFFIQRTYFGSHPVLVNNFSEIKYGCGYGIIVKKKKQKIVSILKKVNWDEYSNLAVHNCRHISMYHIKKALLDNL